MRGNVDHFLKYGGVKFEYRASEQEVRDFINQLPANKRDSLAEVSQILADEGLIDLKPEHSTIDKELLDAQVEENRRI
ncbi:hypothetical protein Halha_1461 [Halobacteroides halobius DSM 5150]|uniref:Uncharacterized protein n=1 Tax=Halobacteroides halobius (strain ATCC 35273 / DSM 5150 / MD-1) TaxID=748449 RepID=L0K8S5_HALHC|nr:hypothetical protein [Halobacteroides halobius]AGB41406.1 hypothetical protein Halha_1461 [Halobacteroides halobius DSM 5150]